MKCLEEDMPSVEVSDWSVAFECIAESWEYILERGCHHWYSHRMNCPWDVQWWSWYLRRKVFEMDLNYSIINGRSDRTQNRLWQKYYHRHPSNSWMTENYQRRIGTHVERERRLLSLYSVESKAFVCSIPTIQSVGEWYTLVKKKDVARVRMGFILFRDIMRSSNTWSSSWSWMEKEFDPSEISIDLLSLDWSCWLGSIWSSPPSSTHSCYSVLLNKDRDKVLILSSVLSLVALAFSSLLWSPFEASLVEYWDHAWLILRPYIHSVDQYAVEVSLHKIGFGIGL